MIKLAFETTNNEAEYEALLVGLEVAELLGAIEVEVKADSQVVVNQVRVGKAQPFFVFPCSTSVKRRDLKGQQVSMDASRQEDSPLLE